MEVVYCGREVRYSKWERAWELGITQPFYRQWFCYVTSTPIVPDLTPIVGYSDFEILRVFKFPCPHTCRVYLRWKRQQLFETCFSSLWKTNRCILRLIWRDLGGGGWKILCLWITRKMMKKIAETKCLVTNLVWEKNSEMRTVGNWMLYVVWVTHRIRSALRCSSCYLAVHVAKCKHKGELRECTDVIADRVIHGMFRNVFVWK
jgi:hypothetical protein